METTNTAPVISTEAYVDPVTAREALRQRLQGECCEFCRATEGLVLDSDPGVPVMCVGCALKGAEPVVVAFVGGLVARSVRS